MIYLIKQRNEKQSETEITAIVLRKNRDTQKVKVNALNKKKKKKRTTNYTKQQHFGVDRQPWVIFSEKKRSYFAFSVLLYRNCLLPRRGKPFQK